MPEEINRVMADSIAEWFLVSEPAGVEHLLREGQPSSKIHLVGDLLVDALRQFEGQARALAGWQRWGLPAGGYALVTLHRPVNVDQPGPLADSLALLRQVSERLPVLFPLHPRTRRRLEEHGLFETFAHLPGLTWCEPLDYLEFVSILSGARVALSDSGGVQLEATVLDVPCLTLRETTERPMTIERGTNTLVGRDRALIGRLLDDVLAGRYKKARLPDYWDGNTAARIVRLLA
jgi:UDP-N-acetylglucosamine 2-epimerase (non-hydrolysing)